RRPSIPLQLRPHFLNISNNPRAEVVQVGITVTFFQSAYRLRTPAAALTMNHYLPAAVNSFGKGFNLAQGKQLTPEVDDVIFIFLAHVNKLEILTVFHPGREFGRADLFDRRLFLLHTAEFVVIDELCDDRMVSVERVFRIPSDLENTRLERKRIEDQKAAAQHLPDPRKDLDDLQGLHASNNTGKHAQHTRLRAVGNKPGWWWRRIKVAVVRADISFRIAVVKHRNLAFKTEDRGVNIWFTQHHARVVYQVACGEIIRAVGNHVVVGDNVQRVFRCKPHLMNFNTDMRIQAPEPFPGGFCLRPADVGYRIQHLTLQVAVVHRVKLSKASRSHARSR